MKTKYWRIEWSQRFPHRSRLAEIISFLSIALSLCLIAPNTARASLYPEAYDAELNGAQRAFPTAEGFGKYAQGGRGGDVYIVSNLSDSGQGSLRECVEASGPRTCVFSVSGEIKTKNRIQARNPYLTIAGQTAPGDGIMLSIRDTDSLTYPLSIETDHVVVRHLAVRPGPSKTQSDNIDAILLNGSHVILDHVTMSWGTDETLNSMGNSGIFNYAGRANSKNITVQWSMIYESLRNANHKSPNHSRSTYLGYGTQDITFHHNIIANSTRRNPNIGGVGQIDYINNVQYNNQQLNGELYSRHGSTYFNWVGNVAIAGPATTKRDNIHQADLFNNQDLGTLEMYVKDNIDINRRTNSGDERLVIDPKDFDRLTTAGQVGYGELSLPYSEISGPEQAYKDVLAFAGATRPWRDEADERFVSGVRQCQGDVIDHPDEVGGWPVLHSSSAPVDSDRDGMADSWEVARGLVPSDADDRNGDDDGDGYTNLEEYLNELAGDDDGSNVGKGTGPSPDPTCGYSFRNENGPTINFFEVSPRAVKAGEPVTVTWDVDAIACKRSWDRGGDPYSISGSEAVIVNESTSFDLICTSRGSDDWENRYVFVNAGGQLPVPSVSFQADRDALQYGDTVTFSWRAGEQTKFEAGECIAGGAWSGFKTTAGQESFRVMNSGDYHLTCRGPGGSTTETVTLDVAGGGTAPPPAVTATIDADPKSIVAGTSTLLNWASTGASSCVGGGFSTGGLTSGGLLVSPNSDTSYSVSCSGTGGAASDSVRVVVTSTTKPASPTASITASPTSISAGNSTTISWSSTDATSCAGSGFNTGGSTSGSVSRSPTVDTTYSVTCSGPGGTASDKVTVNVAPGPISTPPGTGIGVGSLVETTAHVHVRSNPGGVKLGLLYKGSRGTVVGGPGYDDGFTWWKIDFDTGPDGWVRAVHFRVP